MEFNDIATILVGIGSVYAVFKAPLIALNTQKDKEKERAKYDAQFQIFSTLMSERFLGVSLNKTKAYNLIQVNYYGVEAVINAWKLYYHLLHPRTNATSEEKTDAEIKLLQRMAEHLGYKDIDWTELKEAYLPEGISNDIFSERLYKDNQLKIQELQIKALENSLEEQKAKLENNQEHSK